MAEEPSKIFTDIESDLIMARYNGDYSDPHGAFAHRIRPKLKEIMKWYRPENFKVLKKVLQQKRKRDGGVSAPARPNKKSTLEEFTKDIGY